MTMADGKEWCMAAYAGDGIPGPDHLKLRSVQISGDIADGQIAVEPMLISIDPYLRSTMNGYEDGLYAPQFALDQTITTFGIGRVVKSKDGRYSEGDLIIEASLPVADYCVLSADSPIRKIPSPPPIALPEYLSCLGVPGFAAWVALVLIGEPKEGCNVFISAAAGGVGMVAGQLAKLSGCRVIGSAGTDDKVKVLKEEFGYDDAFNYKRETDYDAALTKYFPNGIDIYLDNVGGKMLEAVLNHINSGARIPLCGMISQYNKVWTEREGVRNLLNLVGKNVKMQGFMLGHYLDRFPQFTKEMEDYLIQGKIKSKHKIYNGIESFLESLASLFTSNNTGKVILQLNIGKSQKFSFHKNKAVSSRFW